MAAYSHPDLLVDMRKIRLTVQQGDELPEAQVLDGQVGEEARHRLADRLSEAEVRQLVARFEAGETRAALGQAYGVSVSSVGRLLRRQRDGNLLKVR